MEMKENSYSPGAFTIELNDECYPIAHDMGFQDEKAQSGLLHEYIHYLQDTVTYYGVKYRTELYSKNVNMTVAGGNGNSLLSLPEFAGMKPINIDANGRPTFEAQQPSRRIWPDRQSSMSMEYLSLITAKQLYIQV